MPRRAWITIFAFAVLLGLAGWARVSVGPAAASPEQRSAFVRMRVDRALAGATVGIALAVAGVLLQSLLRNPLASPDLLGLASGAGLGIMVAAYVGYVVGREIVPYGVQTPAALLGAVAALAVVYTLAQRGGWPDPAALVLVGVIVAILCGAGIEVVRQLLPDQGVAAYRLLVGAIRDDLSRTPLLACAGVVAGCVGVAMAAGRAMDAAALSPDEAASVGVPLPALRLLLFAVSGVLTACAVVLAGPIGFVGLIAPHAARSLAGPSHRGLIAAAGLAGGALVVGADVLVKVIDLGTGRLPLGVVTALLGGPAFLVLLRKTRREGI